MFSEWTASRAAGQTLEDVIRRQWAVPSTHSPPTWERVRVSHLTLSAKTSLLSSVQVNVFLLRGRSNLTQSNHTSESEPHRAPVETSPQMSTDALYCECKYAGNFT